MLFNWVTNAPYILVACISRVPSANKGSLDAERIGCAPLRSHRGIRTREISEAGGIGTYG